MILPRLAWRWPLMCGYMRGGSSPGLWEYRVSRSSVRAVYNTAHQPRRDKTNGTISRSAVSKTLLKDWSKRTKVITITPLRHRQSNMLRPKPRNPPRAQATLALPSIRSASHGRRPRRGSPPGHAVLIARRGGRRGKPQLLLVFARLQLLQFE